MKDLKYSEGCQTKEDLRKLAYKLRKDAIDMIMAGGGGHIGGDMSEMEILVELFYEQLHVGPDMTEDPDRDLFVLSKGHSMESYYAVLCSRGFLDLEDVLARFSQFGSPYIGHPHNTLPGIEMNSGSLGHGLPVGVGMALASKMDRRDNRVYVLTGDGELAEGSNWEAFMAGAMYHLDNLCCIVDRNRLQISGRTEEVMALDDLQKKLEAFNWTVIPVADGNDIGQLHEAFEEAKTRKGQPCCIIANTRKGKGVPYIEDQASWHHKFPSAEEAEHIYRDLAAEREALENE